MRAPRAQSVPDADRDLRQYLIRIAATLGDVLGDQLTGLYVHGSLATGAYHRDRSDLNLIGVVSRKLSAAQRAAVARTLVALSDARPVLGDIEVGVVQERYARAFEHPAPYEVHYSSALHEPIRHSRVDFERDEVSVDLAVQMVETRDRGVTLVGPPPGSLFGAVPWHAYINALEADFNRVRPLLMEKPVYAILNASRILHGTTGKTMSVLNKDEAAVWALQTAPRMYHSVINDALQIYRGTKSADDVVFEERDIIALREYVRERSQAAFARASDDGEEE